MATFVLVPGFWLGDWAWRDVTRHLRTAGHEVYPVTLTGVADRVHLATPEVDLDTHITDILNVIDYAGLHDIVLVAHSGANMPVTGVGDRIPARLSRIVYVESGPLPDGMASIDFHDPHSRAQLEKQVESDGDGWLLPVPAFDPAADPANLAELTDQQLTLMRERGTPHPYRAVRQPLRRPQPLPAIPKSLIATTSNPAQLDELAAGGNPAFALMSGPDWTRHWLPTGHWPMFSRPAELAALLDDIATSPK
jgi:pimeloyl-ACP methyl ester carboxylesterase